MGIGIQKIEENLAHIFAHKNILRLDSDTKHIQKTLITHIQEADIILGTNASATIWSDKIGLVASIGFELDLTIPDYTSEEMLYHRIQFAKKSGAHVMIQTYTPDHPIVEIIAHGNARDALAYFARERKEYGYPPYADIAIIRVRDHSEARVKDMIYKLATKLDTLRDASTFLAYDRDIWEKYHDEWIQKITLKGGDIS